MVTVQWRIQTLRMGQEVQKETAGFGVWGTSLCSGYGSGERNELPESPVGVWGGAPAANAFSDIAVGKMSSLVAIYLLFDCTVEAINCRHNVDLLP